MDISKMKVLVIDCSGRQVLPVLYGLHELGCQITTFNCSRLDLGYTSRYPNNKILHSGINSNIDEIKLAVEREIYSGNYDIIIPLGDVMTEYLTTNKEKFSHFIKFPLPDHETFLKAFDKQKTMEICQTFGIDCICTKRFDESIDAFLERIDGYPIVAKPRKGCGSVGFHRINSQSDLNKLLKEKKINFENFVFQEYIDQSGNQYNVHAFMDQNDEIAFIVPTQKCRWFPVDGGSSCFCRTIDRHDLVEQCTKLLKKIHWRGCCEIELIEDPNNGMVKVMEINGRTSASLKIVQLYGINVAKNMLELACDTSVTNQTIPYHDVCMRCIHTDFLWLIKSPKRFSVNPNWFDFRHNHDQVLSLSDPWPFFSYSLQSLMRYRVEMKKRRR